MPIPAHRPESPAGRVHEADGQVLLLGVGHDADTTLHLAEALAEVPYRLPAHCTVRDDGGIRRIDYEDINHCCARFELADGWLRAPGLQREGVIGHAHARLARSRDVVAVACAQLARDPLIFLRGPEAGCLECDQARAAVGLPLRIVGSGPHR